MLGQPTSGMFVSWSAAGLVVSPTGWPVCLNGSLEGLALRSQTAAGILLRLASVPACKNPYLYLRDED